MSCWINDTSHASTFLLHLKVLVILKLLFCLVQFMFFVILDTSPCFNLKREEYS